MGKLFFSHFALTDEYLLGVRGFQKSQQNFHLFIFDGMPKAHKLILNTSTAVGYEDYCHEEHHVDAVYNLWAHDYFGYPLLDNTTNELIKYPIIKIWGKYDRMTRDWEIVLRELLLNNCIQFTRFVAINNCKQFTRFEN